MTKSCYLWKGNTLVIELQVQAKASKDVVVGEHDGRLKICVKAMPENGQANARVIKFLAKYFVVPQKNVEIIRGHTNKYKSVAILDPKGNFQMFKA